MKESKKSFKLFDSVLMSVVVILVVEAAAPSAAIGNSQFFWWIFLFLLFFIPYGLISAELGTTYEDEGGIYGWVKRAFGQKMGSRTAWYYWINFPLWISSLAVLCTSTISQITGVEINTFTSILIELFFIIVVNVVGSMQISNSKWILNIAALIKAFILLSLGIISIYIAFTKGTANEYTIGSLLPSLDINSISFISVIIFNFLGFEVITTLSSDMPNPKKQIPKAIVLGGILIMFFYIISSFGMGVAIPVDELSVSSGLLDSFTLLLGSGGTIFIAIIGILFIATLFSNIISWSFGVNYVACSAAKDHSLPKIFALESKNSKTPIGAAIVNGIVAAILVIVSHIIPNKDIFWNFFALNMITLLLSYVFIFPSFLKLRRIDKTRERPFKIPGNRLFIKCISYIPMVILLLSITFSAVPLSTDADELQAKIPILAGTIIAIIIGEIIARQSHKNTKINSKEDLINENNI